ncbi:hypothetical protein [Peribacillus loiseleuriae]|uniref:Uncharacterized protein n=1 Tax=Peribacillus loiseleuriae TaxID=1679170 RepID=A0A0K9GY86_9BACI|nr:hypothetical protein [Peribacillus loiseleuriae]KMY51623.1 hypothetical protein AC625_20440 [Peribacillus loiseleuriae]
MKSNNKEDNFEFVARFRISEMPSDYNGNHESYISLYDNEDETGGFTEEYEAYIRNNVYPNKKQ